MIRDPHARHPMTAPEAVEILAAMKAETPKNAQKFIIKTAISAPFANLSDEAKELYRARLAEL
jgi:hypothetical protein